jgi:hypothetical protein
MPQKPDPSKSKVKTKDTVNPFAKIEASKKPPAKSQTWTDWAKGMVGSYGSAAKKPQRDMELVNGVWREKKK